MKLYLINIVKGKQDFNLGDNILSVLDKDDFTDKVPLFVFDQFASQKLVIDLADKVISNHGFEGVNYINSGIYLVNSSGTILGILRTNINNLETMKNKNFKSHRYNISFLEGELTDLKVNTNISEYGNSILFGLKPIKLNNILENSKQFFSYFEMFLKDNNFSKKIITTYDREPFSFVKTDYKIFNSDASEKAIVFYNNSNLIKGILWVSKK